MEAGWNAEASRGGRSVGGEGDQGEQGREQDVSGDDENEDGHGIGFRGLAADGPGRSGALAEPIAPQF